MAAIPQESSRYYHLQYLASYGSADTSTPTELNSRNHSPSAKEYTPFELEDIKSHYKFFEGLSNHLNDTLLGHEVSRTLAQTMEVKKDHGYNHYRRVEKGYKDLIAHDEDLKRDPNMLYFTFVAFNSIRLHDLIEIHTNKKEGHDAAGALLALGFLMKEYHTVAQYSDPPIEEDDWKKLVWGTAFSCRHHSKPEKMPGVEQLFVDGKFQPDAFLDPVDLVNQTQAMADRAGQDLYDFFPPFQLIRDEIEAIRNSGQLSDEEKAANPLLTPPTFTQAEIDGLEKQAKLFAAADKLDGLLPADLSTTRVFLTRPDRVFHSRIDADLSLEEELKIRTENGGGQESHCDLNRLLFEIQRVGTFDGLSDYLQDVYLTAIVERGQYLHSVIPAFLTGDFRPFEDIYEGLRQSTLQSLFQERYKLSQEEQNRLQNLTDEEITYQLEGSEHFDASHFNDLMFQIRQERNMVFTSLHHKFSLLEQENLSSEERTRIQGLLDRALQNQKEGIETMGGYTERHRKQFSYYHTGRPRMNVTNGNGSD